jgi:predicted permease
VTPHPPRLAQLIVSAWVSEPDRECLLGDLDEQFADAVRHGERFGAWRRYWSQALRSAWQARSLNRRRVPARRWSPKMTGFWKDLQLAARRLRHQPGFSAMAVLTLALGLGANTAIFTLVHALMWQVLPVTNPEELYRLGDDNECCVNSGLETNYSLFSYPLYLHLRDHAPQFRSLAAFQPRTESMAIRRQGTAAAVPVPAELVSGNYFATFGARAAAGRLLQDDDDRPGAPPAFVISHRTWTEEFAQDPSIVGSTIMVNGTAMTLVGVTAEGFFGDTVRADPAGVWIPIGQELALRGAASLAARPDQEWLYAVGRIAPGSTPAVAEAQVTADLRQWLTAQTFIPASSRPEIARQRILVVSAAGGVQSLRLAYGPSLLLLFAMSGLVLLIASANLANLLLARADRGEAALRVALGASGSRLARQSLAEGVVLAVIGGGAALLVASAATRSIVALVFPTAGYVPIDVTASAPILGFALLLALLTALAFTAAPAWAAARTDPIGALRGVGRSGSERAFIPRRSLVVVQVALSLVLLTGAGLLGRSLSQLERQPLGFETERRFVVYINPPAIAGATDRLASLYARMRDRIAGISGVESVSYSLYSPMEGNNWSGEISIAGRAVNPSRPDSASWNRVGPRYFETLGTRVLRGRSIQETETPSSERVAVVNEAFVQFFFTGANPLGRHLGIGDASHANDYAIVGMVEDVKYSGANRPTVPMIFLPALQTVAYADPTDGSDQTRSMLMRTLVVRLAPGGSSGLEPLVRRALADVDPNLTVVRLRAMADQVGVNFRLNRLMARLTTAYGLLAMALASLGLYGVTAYGVARRRREIGVRLALGAKPARIVREIVRGAIIQAGVGLLIGVAFALLAANTMATLLYGVTARNPVVPTVAALVLLASAALAALVPARRAAAVNPTEALRGE